MTANERDVNLEPGLLLGMLECSASFSDSESNEDILVSYLHVRIHQAPFLLETENILQWCDVVDSQLALGVNQLEQHHPPLTMG